MVDWKKLEDEVENAIRKDCSITFDSKTIKECEYQQKVADDKKSRLEYRVSIIILLIGLGASTSIAFSNIFNLETLVKYLIGIIFMAIGGVALFQTKGIYERCSRIILNAEKRILSDDNSKEPNQQQETPQNQERIEPIAKIKEDKKGFFDGTIGIIILFFTVYAFTRDYFLEDKSKATDALYAAIFFVGGLVIVLFVLINYIIPKIRIYISKLKKLNLLNENPRLNP